MPAIADRVKMAYVKETTFGSTPSSPTLQYIPFTSESFAEVQRSADSEEIRGDRQVEQVPRLSVMSQGTLGFEMRYGTYDDFWAMVHGASMTWSSVVTVSATTISFAAASGGTQVITDSGSGFGSIVAGQWVRISGADAANNGYFKVTAAAAGSITVRNPDGTLESAGDSIEIEMGAQIVNGTTADSVVFERTYSDLSNIFAVFNGQTLDSATISVVAGAKITGTFAFKGTREVSGTSTISTGGGPTAVTSVPIMTASEDAVKVTENYTDIGVQSVELTFAAGLRERPQVGSLAPVSYGQGKFKVTGTLRMFFETVGVMNRYLDNTESSLSFVLEDSNGNAYCFDLPRIIFTDGKRVAGGENTDIIADMAFTAYVHATELVTARLTRWAA